MIPLPVDDLDRIVQAAGTDLSQFDGAHLVITGGTGFVGSWLVESCLRAIDTIGLQLRITVPSRDPAAHLHARPHLAVRPELTFVRADVRGALDQLGRADAIVHAATEASAALNETRPDEMLDVIVAGMSNVLDYARTCGDIPFLFTSSGAVYGRQPPNLTRIPETYLGAPDPLDPFSAYHEGKRLAELLGAITSSRSSVRFVSARLFAFLGPLLPLDAHFAAGNFMRDALQGSTIRISGDGTPRRTYHHPIDMCVALWALLARGEDRRAYNVGSDHDVSIAELAALIAEVAGTSGVEIDHEPIPGVPPPRYVPDTHRLRSELDVSDTIALDDAIARTMAWHRRRIRA